LKNLRRRKLKRRNKRKAKNLKGKKERKEEKEKGRKGKNRQSFFKGLTNSLGLDSKKAILKLIICKRLKSWPQKPS
jgi:hypothetical protein